MHVEVEAEVVVAGDLLVALAIGEEPVQQVDRLVGGPGRGVGSEVLAAVVDDQAGADHPRPLLVGDLDVGVRLAVLQHDVVLGLVLLDQLVLEDQRLGRGVGADHLEVGDVVDQLACLRVAVPRGLKVGADAVAQRHRLADIEDRPGVILHQVDTRRRRQRRQSGSKMRVSVVHGHDIIIPCLSR
jgi:hypothetical protein